MKGTVYRQCWCRDPETGKKLHSKCPDLRKKGHGSWYYRYDAPVAEGERRRQPVAGPFPTRKEAEEHLAATLARIGGGGTAADRTLKVGPYLDDYLASKINLKARSRATDAEAFRLYWKPALGHMRMTDVRRRHVEEVIREMLRINRPDAGKPSEMMRRMMLVRADDERRELAEGEERRKKSAKPLSAARVARMFAPFRAAMNSARPAMFLVSPCEGVELPRGQEVKALGWTAPREAAFRRALGQREREAAASRPDPLPAMQRQELWASPGLRPSPVMVWMPAHAARFLEYAAGERLYALYCLVMFCGLRRDEVIGLAWSEVDLDGGFGTVRATGGGDGPKSESGKRPVPMADRVVRAMRAWRKAQDEERLGWGPAWTDTGLAFTREDGTAIPGQWLSRRFETLAFRAGLPPVRFHDLRHGAASLAKAAGLDTKYISSILGHSRTSFTDKTYVLLFPDLERAAANLAAGVVPEASGDAAVAVPADRGAGNVRAIRQAGA